MSIEGILFDNIRVKLDPQSILVGGSWEGGKIEGIPVAWETNTIKFFFQKICELETLRGKPIFVVDVGANTGSYCLLGILNPNIQCFAFEPAPLPYKILKKNIVLNDLQDKVKTFQVALSDKKGTDTLNYPRKEGGSGQATLGKLAEDTTGINVRLDRLDEIITEKIDILKIDTEGHELFVLKGAEKLIKKTHPDILVETTSTKKCGYNPVEIPKLLNSWGYDYGFQIDWDNFYFHHPQRNPGFMKLIEPYAPSNLVHYMITPQPDILTYFFDIEEGKHYMLYSADEDVRSLSVCKNGFLYDITTNKKMDGWWHLKEVKKNEGKT